MNRFAGRSEFRFLFVFMAVVPFLSGLYFEYFSCLSGIVLCCFLFYTKYKTGKLYFRLNDASAAVIVLVLFYGISVFFASDKGIAVWGVFKFYPLLPFLLLLFQLSREERLQLMGQIPFTASVMTILSCMLLVVPFFRNYLLVNGRLGGFFQYPNTFAMYLLSGLIVLYAGDIRYSNLVKKILTGILLCGILLSGSRTVAGLLIISAGVLLRRNRYRVNEKSGFGDKRETKWHNRRLIVLFFAVMCISFAVLFGVRLNLFGNSFLGHFSLSTFWGRLLYFYDAIGQIIRHPFGLGYMGYYLNQSIFQSGVYSVMYVHNDWLQILLDVGWIPAFFMALAVIKTLISKNLFATQRTVLLFLGLHCMFDFDLQYLSIFFLLLMTFDLEAEKKYCLPSVILVPAAVAAAASIYIGLANFVYYMGDLELACRIYRYNTFAELKLLTQTQDAAELEKIADHILERNENLSLAWNAKAKAAYSQGDFETVISSKRKAISLAKYDISSYEDYFKMLTIGVSMYDEAGYGESAEFCRQEIRTLQLLLDEAAENTSWLAWMTADKPELEMSEQYKEYVAHMDANR